MKLQRQVGKRYKGTDHFKHWIVLPNALIDALGWHAGDDLTAERDAHTLRLRKSSP